MRRFAVASLLALVSLHTGCAALEFESAKLAKAPTTRTAPPASQFEDCLRAVFTERIPSDLIERLHEEVKTTRTAFFEIEHPDARGTHNHHYFISYLEGPQVLVLGRLHLVDHEVSSLQGWYVPNPIRVARRDDVQPEKLPCPRPDCPSKGEPVIVPGKPYCPRCGKPVE